MLFVILQKHSEKLWNVVFFVAFLDETWWKIKRKLVISRMAMSVCQSMGAVEGGK